MGLFGWLPWVRRKRAELFATPLDPDQRATLASWAPFTATLDAEATERLHGLIQLFLHDKTFEGCGGLELDEVIPLVIAAHACHLLLGLDVQDPYPGLDVIRVYPSTYRASQPDLLGGHLVEGGVSHRLGESSHHGYVVLSWDAVRRGVRVDDGHNVVLHEFAHQLDGEDGVSDGAPVLPRSLYGPWAKVLGQAFDHLQHDVAHERQSVLDAYGATNPAEFFAVATETFFERPDALREQEPRLYAVLARYYGQQPGSV